MKKTNTIFLQDNEKIPTTILPWLTMQSSLTRKFETLANQPLRVMPLFEGYRYLNHTTSQELQLARQEMAWIREVELYGNDEQAWATAKSIFPISALNGSAKRLRYLNNTPLGYILFGRHKPSCQRMISIKHIGNQCYYSRHNFYRWHHHLILVQETFMPAFLEKISL